MISIRKAVFYMIDTKNNYYKEVLNKSKYMNKTIDSLIKQT